MDSRLKEIIKDLSNSVDLQYSKSCIKIIDKNEIIIDDNIILDREQALFFFNERYERQSFLNDEKLKIIKRELITYMEELSENDKIIMINITEIRCDYLILKSLVKNKVFGILRGFNNLKKKKQYINTLANNSIPITIGVTLYNRGVLIKRYN